MSYRQHPLAFDDLRLCFGASRVSFAVRLADRGCGSATRGFTTIELLIAMAIVAILVTLALPAYNSTLVRSNRAAAQSYILDLANRQEQYLLDARTYTTVLADLLAVPAAVAPYYTVTISVPTGTTIANAYLITATPITTSMQKNDGALTVNQDGVKTGTW